MIALRPHARVGVRLLAQQFNVLAFAAQQLCKFLCTQLRTLIVIGDDLRHGDTGFVDLTVNQKGRDTGIFGFLHRPDGGVRAGVIQNDRFRFARNRGLNQLVLLVNVIVVRRHQRGVTQLFGFG